MTSDAFIFDTEFTHDGQVLSQGERAWYSREEASQLSSKARAEGEKSAHDKGVAALQVFLADFNRVHAGLVQAAAQVREEAAELALAAARKIAGAALDANGEAAAIDALTNAIRNLKTGPSITVFVPKDALPALLPRMEKLKSEGLADSIRLKADEGARPGDWRIEWADGAQGFDREKVTDAIEQAVRARLQDPVEEQPDLFSAA